MFSRGNPMSDFEERRSAQRYRKRFPGAIKLSSGSRSCLADLVDVSSGGIGIEYFDMSRFLDVMPNDVVTIEFLLKSQDIPDPEARDTIRMLEDRLLGPGETSGDASERRSENNMSMRARVAWIYLNRLGLQFLPSR
jgi:hypothetical protein